MMILRGANCQKEKVTSSPMRVITIECCITGILSVEESRPDSVAGLQTLYREQERRKRVRGWRRTHKDPFDGEWEQILSWLMANPERSSGDIFRELQRRSPGSQTREEQWQAEVIRGPSPPPISSEARPTRSSRPPVEYAIR